MYKILGTDQKEYGPAGADEIRKWIAEGRITGRTQMRLEGSNEWKFLADFHEFDATLGARGVPPGSTAKVVPPPLPPPIFTGGPPAKGMAIASLVLGVLSVMGCLFIASIPAIILGHIAYKRSRKAPRQFGGEGLAIAGFAMGYLGLLLIPIFASIILPALAKAKEKAQKIQCVNNMKQIGLAARIWAGDHGDKFPPDFISMSNELSSPKILVCPADSSKTIASNWAEFGPENISYEYLEPGHDEKDPSTTVFECPIHSNIGLSDGSVLQGGPRNGGMRMKKKRR